MSVGKKPRAPLPRYTALRSSGRITPKPRKALTTEQKADRAAKREKKFAREFGSDARVRWIKYVLACVGCGRIPNYDFPNDNAHTANEGKSRKGHHSTIAPLCATSLGGIGCHTKYDQHLAPFNTEDARDAIKLQAAVTDAQWKVMGETRRSA
jgi:hypothetical protein